MTAANLRESKRQQAAAKKAPAKKAPAKKAAARVAPLPKDQWKLPAKPAALTWETKTVKGIEYLVAEGARHLYRVWHGEGGDWYAAQKLKAGSWSPMAGKCKSREDAQQLAGFNEAGATWLAYRDVVGTEFAKLVETYGADR
jgi:hypothetical protein